jgi:regulatory protein YycI of two-component signal transduction system YycFG
MMNWKEIGIMFVVVLLAALAALYTKQYFDNKATA